MTLYHEVLKLLSYLISCMHMHMQGVMEIMTHQSIHVVKEFFIEKLFSPQRMHAVVLTSIIQAPISVAMESFSFVDSIELVVVPELTTLICTTVAVGKFVTTMTGDHYCNVFQTLVARI